jgi:beta-alanine degradation protein BauB
MLSPADVASNPIGTDLIFEDDRVRIWEIVLDPGQEAAVHTHHLDYTTVVVEGGVVERLNADGTTDRREVQPGDIQRWYQSTARHGLRNVGTTRFRNVIVEVKSLPAAFGADADGGRPQ